MLNFDMLLKLSISLILIILSFIATYTMFEIFGKTEGRKNMDILKKIHRINGRLFFMIFLFGAIACIYMLSQSKAELTPRATLHAFSAVAIFLLFSLKILFIKYYRQFYSYAKLMGVLIVLLTFNLLAFSTGYSLVTGQSDRAISTKEANVETIASKDGNVENGKRLFSQLCSSCHYTDRRDFRRAAPGLKGLFKEKTLPVSKRPVTDENVTLQIKNPYRYMPSFNDLTDAQIRDIISYLKTL
ncbi:cytochrome c2 [Thermodesulfovibrio aggregans]|uniref:Cytochrome c2 n=2 Tax=Thermodesulfovibrio aggregans TaxID=86166 RepID=A0A0U9HN96_9BACT|nr:cytochrome c2 [Thermodesulfovibrio aggregans]